MIYLSSIDAQRAAREARLEPREEVLGDHPARAEVDAANAAAPGPSPMAAAHERCRSPKIVFWLEWLVTLMSRASLLAQQRLERHTRPIPMVYPQQHHNRHDQLLPHDHIKQCHLIHHHHH